MFGSRVGFSGSVDQIDRMSLYFGSYQIQDGGQPPSWKILNGRMSVKGHAIDVMLRFYGWAFRAPILCNTHRAVIFAIAQLSCRRPRPTVNKKSSCH